MILDELEQQFKQQNEQGFHFYIQRRLVEALSYYKQAHAHVEMAQEVIRIRPGQSRQVVEKWRTHYATIINNIGCVYQEQGDFGQALDYFQQALAIYRASAPHLSNRAMCLNNIGCIYQKQGDFSQSLRYLQQALDINEADAPYSTNTAINLNNIGSVHNEQGDLAQALDYFQQAIDVLEQMREQTGSMTGRQRFSLQHQDPYYGYIFTAIQRDAPGDVGRAFQKTEMTRARTIVEQMRRSAIRAETDEQQKLLDEQLKTLNQIVELEADPSLHIQNAKRRADLVRALSELETRINVAFPGLATLQGVPPLTLEQARQRVVPPGTLLLSFCAAGPYYIAWAAREADWHARGGDVTSGEQAFPVANNDELEAALRDIAALFSLPPLLSQINSATLVGDGYRQYAAWKETLATARQNETRAWEFLRTVIWNQVRPELKEGVERLLILPDGELNNLPFDLLPLTGNDGESVLSDTSAPVLLGDRYEITYAPSATALDQLQKMWDARSAAPNGAPPPFFLGFGDPNFEMPDDDSGNDAPSDSAARPRLGATPLPLVQGAPARRSRRKAQSAPGTMTTLDAPRHSRAWVPALPGTRWELQKIAECFPDGNKQAFYDSDVTKENIDRYLKQATILHGATHGVFNNAEPLKSGLMLAGGRIWEAREILGRHEPLYLELMVGSACDTARGATRTGEGLVGLRAALMAVGVRCALLSLWPVSDAATGEFMVAFYDHWQGGERPIHEALRVARVTVKAIPGFDDPYYWAGFVPIGLT